MFGKRKKKDVPTEKPTTESKQPTLREIEELFITDDYPLKGKKPNSKM